MKKIFILILIIINLFLVGCKYIPDVSKDDSSNISDNSELINQDKKDNTKDTSVEEDKKELEETIDLEYNIKDFVGIKANERYNYSGENSEYAEYERYVDYIEGNKYQIRVNNNATEVVSVIEATEDELKIVFRRGECSYRENFLNKSDNSSEILIKSPIEKGTEWTLSDGSKRYISSTDAKVSTNIDEFNCIEVTTENKSGQKDLQYYAKDIGLVKEVKDVENMKVTSTLASIDNDVTLNQVIRFYYSDQNAEYMIYEDVPMSFKTNDITKLNLQKKFREYKILNDIVSINSLYLNDDGMVYLDISKNFVSEMVNGTAGEYFAIYGLVNTIGRYYEVDNIYITLDGNNYESGHIVKCKGESFNIDLSRVQ